MGGHAWGAGALAAALTCDAPQRQKKVHRVQPRVVVQIGDRAEAAEQEAEAEMRRKMEVEVQEAKEASSGASGHPYLPL